MVRPILKIMQRIFAYPASPVTRREMFTFVARNSLFAASAGFIAWDRCDRFRETAPIKIESELKLGDSLKQSVLSILEEARLPGRMSSRYEPFLQKSVQLIKEDKIKIEQVTSNGTDGASYASSYNSGTNTLHMNSAFKLQHPLVYKSHIIHELFHSYQDYLRKQERRSVSEAAAYLVEADYLVCHGRTPNKHWLNLIEDARVKGSYFVSFNVPGSVVSSARNAAFSSAEYQKAIKRIAENYLWMSSYDALYTMYANAVDRFEQSGLSVREIEREQRKLLLKMQGNPRAVLKGPSLLETFIGATRYLVDRLWVYGKKNEAELFFNKTFDQLKRALRGYVNHSNFNRVVINDGI